MNQRIIAPSILAADFGNLTAEIASVEQGGADWLHIDVMDGSFVPPITFGVNMISLARKVSKLFLDVHLMIQNPDLHLAAFKDAGSDRITVHQETCPHLHRTLGSIRALGISSGVTLNPGTPIDSIFPVLEVADLVLVMTVNPGWGGQAFLPSCLEKIRKVRTEIDKRNLKTLIQVDGGITPETARQCYDAGATVFVAGSSIFNSADRKLAISNLRK